MKQKDIDFVMWLVGDQKVGNEDYTGALRKLINEYQLDQNVFLLGWRDDVAALMNLAQFVVLPTW